jgi:hypothetical protein
MLVILLAFCASISTEGTKNHEWPFNYLTKNTNKVYPMVVGVPEHLGLHPALQ